MSADYTVADLVAEFLAACGVTNAFGIASVHNIPMLDAIGRRNTIRFLMARGELGGAHMADGYARVNGGLGVIFSSTGPGAANAIGGLIEARFAGSPGVTLCPPCDFRRRNPFGSRLPRGRARPMPVPRSASASQGESS